VDERRHNMDGALFVEDEARPGEPQRSARADEPRRGGRAGEPRRTDRAVQPRDPQRAGQPRDPQQRAGQPRDPQQRAGQPRDPQQRAGQPRDPQQRTGQPRDPQPRADQRDPQQRVDQRDPQPRAGQLRDLPQRADLRDLPQHTGEARHAQDADEPRDDDRDDDGDDDLGPLADDEKADDARRVTQSILDRMDLDARVTIREDDERVVLDIDGPDAGRAIGKKGMTLEALQFLVNKIVNREPDERRHIVLDSGDYRERHDSGLVAMAKREAKRAVSSGRAVTLEPMSARDRRVIHVSLAKFPGVSTRSEGEGSDRRLQIIPARGGGGRERDERSSERSRDRPRAGGREGRGPGPGPSRLGPPGQGQAGAGERPQRGREAEPETVLREPDLDYRERADGERGLDERDRGYDRGDD
jgi:spoIIIJ-associated protein